MNYTIIIGVDENDGDYVTSVSTINEEELAVLVALFEKVKAFRPYTGQSTSGYIYTHTHNFPWNQVRNDLGEKSAVELYDIDEDTVELLLNVLPNPEYGFHDIVTVTYHPAVQETRLLQLACGVMFTFETVVRRLLDKVM